MVRQQISISVPEELHQRLEEYRDTLNISEICREALGAKLDEIESRRKDKKNMTVIARLKKEKHDLDNASLQAGREAFDLDLEKLPYKTLLDLTAISLSQNWGDSDYPLNRLMEILELDKFQDDLWKERLESFERVQFALGYIKRAQERWKTDLSELSTREV
jgi:hypothetical protein